MAEKNYGLGQWVGKGLKIATTDPSYKPLQSFSDKHSSIVK
jgi:hypothetical protein